MKKLISFLIAWSAFFQAGMAQPKMVDEKVYIDSALLHYHSNNSEISLDLLVGENQKYLKKMGEPFVETPPAVIDIQEKTKGNKHAIIYVNNDHINVICHGIDMSNFSDYKVYKQYLHTNENNADSIAYPLELLFSASNPPMVADDQLNDEKVRLFTTPFRYSIRDKTGRVVAGLTLEFVFPKPAISQIYINKELIQVVRDRPAESIGDLKGLTERNNMELARENDIIVGPNDTTNVPSRLVLRPGIHDILFQFKALNIRTDNYLEYKLSDADTWKTTSKKEYPHILLEDLQPGRYALQVRYPKQPAVLLYEFELEPGFTQTILFRVILGGLIIGTLGVVLFLMYSSRQKKKLQEEVDKRSRLQHRISYLQSQLQPHFIFNALNSIQGLINKRNIEDANIYISKFGALLHEVIGKNDKTMQPLATEIKQVEYYLQLEQLRFKFQYKISVDENVNTTEVSIPTMLLQPFVENAIKHGIVEKKESGIIEVIIGRKQNDLLIKIKDNGKGYDVNTTSAGRGNKMVEERIQALNNFLHDQRITLNTSSTVHTGTTVSITFINWF